MPAPDPNNTEARREWLRDQLRRRKRVMPDGERLYVPMMMMDAAYGFHQTFSDGSPDHTNPHQPGFRFLDTNDANGLAADEAYAERSKRMESGWRRKGDAAAEANRDAAPPPRTRDAAQLRAAADQAWEERNTRMRNAWKQK